MNTEFDADAALLQIARAWPRLSKFNQFRIMLVAVWFVFLSDLRRMLGIAR